MLLIIQSILVVLIASLSGREVSLDAAREFIFSMSGIGVVGYGFKVLAQQASKLLNTVWPGSGSAVSSVVAFAGTSAIGNAAIAYYIDGQGLDVAKQKFEEVKKEHEE